jgi:NAD(P)-dependent dehydrogenase (short-subunit alcohol dehydrogenase family)
VDEKIGVFKMGRVQNRVAIVTGAASGIGEASAIRLAEEGAKVICADLNLTGAEETADSEQCDALAADTLKRYGSIDILVNNAGVNLPGTFHEVPNEIIQKTLQVNVAGMMYLSRACIPQMLKQKSGSIVNMSSINGLVSEPFLAVYSASKGAVVMLTRGIALDYAKTGIRCNAICPGWVDTPINYAHADLLGGINKVYDGISVFQPIGRPGEPREIAHLVLFLASDEASFITGSIISADGGMSAM